MKTLWLWWLPLLFLPNFGTGRATSFGTLELSDYLIGPYLLLLLLALRPTPKTQVQGLLPFMIGFVAWAAIGLMLIPVRYDYTTDKQLLFCALKLAKFCLYGTAGYLTIRALSQLRDREPFIKALLISGLIAGAAMIIIDIGGSANTGAGYKASNGSSVMLAILITFCTGYFLAGEASPSWRRLAWPSLIIMGLGFLLTQGRGGWLAGFMGCVWVISRVKLGQHLILVMCVASAAVTIAYVELPTFRDQISLTFTDKNPYAHMKIGTPIESVNEGGRLQTWIHEAPQLLKAPIVGTGFHHRGGQSGLWSTGSHNFWLQIFLETGLLGGILMLILFGKMWRQARTARVRLGSHRVPVEGALIAAFVGGLGGDYFYGGIIMLTALLTYAPVGALIASTKPQATRLQAHKALPPRI